MSRSVMSRESPYATFVRQFGLNSPEVTGWSGRGSHIEFKRREDIPLATHEVLGSGGYSVVQKVIHKSNDERPLAQKIIRDYRTGLEAIMNEVKHIQQLRHRHVIQLVGTYALGWNLHILLFPVGQWNLKQFLGEFHDANMDRKAYPEFCNLGTFFKCLACALAYLHNEVTPHIKHLDIKPENVIVKRYATHRLTVFLTDFGVSRSFHPAATSQDINTLYTTPIYAAPEVAQHKPFGRPADIFSLGCVFSEMASVLGGRTLLEYSNQRRCERGDGSLTVAFESNLKACKSWLHGLRSNAPFRQLSTGDSAWWRRLLELIEDMLSGTASGRPNSMNLVNHFPPGPCCGVALEEYNQLSECMQQVRGDLGTATPQAVVDIVSSSDQGPGLDASSVALQTIALSTETHTSAPYIGNVPKSVTAVTEIDWSGKGTHVGYDVNELVPLEQLEVIGLGASSLVTKVRSTRCGPYIFAKKTLEKRGHLLQLEMLLREVRMLQKLHNPHIIRLIGTLDEKRFFSLLIYPAAEWNLRTFMETISSEGDLQFEKPELRTRKWALQKFFKCLMQGLYYLHSQHIKHKDIKPSNILVRQLQTGDDFHVYLADFGLSTKFDRGYGSQTAGMTGHTPMYASPEVLSTSRRGRASDIFSMGCVWLEMYTVLLGERLEDFEQHRMSPSESSEDDFEDIETPGLYGDFSGFAASLPRVHKWTERLTIYCNMHGSLILGGAENFPSLNVSCNEIIQGLHNVEQMLQEDPNARPDAATLCQKTGANQCCEQDVAPFEIAEGFAKVEANPETASQRPGITMTLPFRRDEDFVGREDILQVIGHMFAESKSLRRVGLVGLGGVGKSQIAIEYAYRLRYEFPKTWIFWVHANSSARFEQSYRAIANAVKLPGLDEPKNDIFDLVFKWLDSDSSADWLMILDNADDTSMFFTHQAALIAQKSDRAHYAGALSTYLPENPRGSILVTSRNRNAAIRLTGGEDRIIKIDGMKEEDAKVLLRKKLPNDQSDETDRKLLVQALGYLPLAITQAAAYIAVKGPRMTISKYLKYFRDNEVNQMFLLNKDGGDLRRDPEAPNSVLITWQISFEQIKIQNDSAADLLSRMCVLDRQGIPKFLFCGGESDSLDFEDAIGTLIEFLFITAQKDERVFEMHPLVQLSTRRWLQARGQLQRRKEEALRLLSHRFPSDPYVNWEICEALEPHAQIVLGYSYVPQHCKLERADILHNSAWYALARGRYGLAKGRIQEAVDTRENLLGPDDPDTLGSLSVLASVLDNQGQWQEAEDLKAQIMKTSLRVLGQEHPDALTSIGNLASTYGNQGRWKEAEELEVQVLKTRERVLGQEHPSTLTSMANLASTFWNQGRWKEAEELEMQVMEMRKRMQGKEHPYTLNSMGNLASTYGNQGRWKEAEELEVQVMETSLRVLGEEHPDTLISMNNLAFTLKSQGRDVDANELMIECVRLRKKILGMDHPDSQSSIEALNNWQAEGRLDDTGTDGG